MTNLKESYRQLLFKLCKFDKLGLFQQPVNVEDVPDYYDVIQHPMCFDQMREVRAGPQACCKAAQQCLPAPFECRVPRRLTSPRVILLRHTGTPATRPPCHLFAESHGW